MIEQYVSPPELKRLLSALLVLVLFLALLAVFAFLVLPGLRNSNQPDVETPSGVVGGGTGWLDPADFPPERGRALPPIDPRTVMTPDPALLARGKALFSENCQACHGEKGTGDGPAGTALDPRPRDFTRKDGWKRGARISDIYQTVSEGLKGSAMASFDYLSRKDRMALVHYVRSLGSFDHGPEDPAALASLARSFASSGEVIPNRIPLSVAMRKLEAEFTRAAPLPRGGGPVLTAAVTDPARAGQTLAQITGWRTSDRALARIALGAPGNGFAPSVALYTPAQWRRLRDALGRALKEEPR